MKRGRALVALVAAIAAANPPEAAPKYTDIATIRTEASNLVIRTMMGSSVIDIDTVVRGTATRGPRTFTSAPNESVFAQGRVVAMIDTRSRYDFDGDVAIELAHRSGSSGPVSPGGLAATLVQQIDAKGYTSCTLKQNGAPDRSCTLRRGTSKFIKR